MLSEDQLKPLLLHIDPYIRELASIALAECWTKDKEAGFLFFQSYLRYGQEPNVCFSLPMAHHFPLDESSFELLLECLSRPLDARVRGHFNRAAALAPLAILEAKLDDLRACRSFDRDVLTTIQHRRELAGWSGGRLWRELQEMSKRMPEAGSTSGWSRDDGEYADLMIEALATHQIPDPESARRLLRSTEPETDWLKNHLVTLIGERRMEGMIPLLLDELREDEGLHSGRIGHALIKLGDPAAPTMIQERYLSETSGFRMSAAIILSAMRMPEAETALIHILENETDTLVRSMAYYQASRAFSEPCARMILEFIDRDDFDPSSSSLRQDALPVFDVFGIDHPRAHEWREERERERERLAIVARQWDSIAKLSPSSLASLSSMSSPSSFSSSSLASTPNHSIDAPASFSGPSEVLASSAPVATIRKDGPKVGRNDPCPCGSGKKHKKCCG